MAGPAPDGPLQVRDALQTSRYNAGSTLVSRHLTVQRCCKGRHKPSRSAHVRRYENRVAFSPRDRGRGGDLNRWHGNDLQLEGRRPSFPEQGPPVFSSWDLHVLNGVMRTSDPASRSPAPSHARPGLPPSPPCKREDLPQPQAPDLAAACAEAQPARARPPHAAGKHSTSDRANRDNFRYDRSIRWITANPPSHKDAVGGGHTINKAPGRAKSLSATPGFVKNRASRPARQ